MQSTSACLSVYASTFWELCWRLVMRALLVFHLAASLRRSFFSPASILGNRRWKSSSPSASRLWWSPMLNCGEITPMMRCPHLLLCQSDFQTWLHPLTQLHQLSRRSIMLRLWRLLLLFRGDEQYASVYVLHAVVHLLHSARGALHQQAHGAESAGPQGVPEVPSPE